MKKQLIKDDRYRIEDGVLCIDVRVDSLKQLFDQRDPAPFLEKDLDDDFTQFLLDNLREIPLNKPAKVIVIFSKDLAPGMDEETITQAIRGFYLYEVRSANRSLELLFKQGRFSLVLGFFFLVSCIGLAQALTTTGEWWLNATIKETLTVAGWVAFWKPINIFLYEWWPIVDRRKYFERLAVISVELRRFTAS